MHFQASGNLESALLSLRFSAILNSTSQQPFQIEGAFRGFFKDVFGRHRMALFHEGREIFLKVPKQLRKKLQNSLPPDSSVTAVGFMEYDSKIDCERPLVCRIELLKNEKCLACPIFVCTHKHCWNNGGDVIWKHLKQQIAAGDFGDVELKAVDCFGSCSKGPNIEFAGNKYNHCSSRDAEKILEPLLPCDTI